MLSTKLPAIGPFE